MGNYKNDSHDDRGCDENLAVAHKEKHNGDFHEDCDDHGEMNSPVIDEIKYSPQKNNVQDNENILGILIGLIAALFLGLLGAAIIDSIIGYRCPYCKCKLEKDVTYCKYCHKTLGWN